jgi:hypothetical protein
MKQNGLPENVEVFLLPQHKGVGDSFKAMSREATDTRAIIDAATYDS